MNSSKLFVLTACALSFSAFVCAAQAQQSTRSADPSDPRGAPADAAYHSVFTDYTPMQTRTGTPDQLWRQDNDEVGASAGEMAGMVRHAAHMQPAEAAPSPHGADAAQVRTAPAAAGKNASQSEPVDHAAMGHGAHPDHQGH